ncbi:hypothetical protein ACIPSE_13915 [Streptomyces sp. NPDC090106]|uniref:hypothetical protein n=1 Tax=Streptomyces sp. NPDC090106 TaxID=3365946 RepID=UPI00380DCC25
MPRGRHRHSPPLHRLLPPSSVAGVSAVCALAPWVFSQATLLRGLAAVAAVTAVTGAFVMRRWDAQAGKQVADLTRARASDEWRFEERVAELETDLEESRELRGKLEQRLRAKRGELAGLRNEHAALLRRYATAETERATALEGRRLLEIEAAPAHELPPGPGSVDEDDDLVEDETETVAAESEGESEGETPGSDSDADSASDSASDSDSEAVAASDEETPAIFSPEGSKLFLRAKAALSRLDEKAEGAGAGEDEARDGDAEVVEELDGPGDEPDEVVETAEAAESEASRDDDPADEASAEETSGVPSDGASAEETPEDDGSPKDDGSPDGGGGGPRGDAPVKDIPAQAGPVAAEVVEAPGTADAPSSASVSALPSVSASASAPASGDGAPEAAREDDVQGKPGAVDEHEHERAAAGTTTTAKPAQPARQPSGHFVAPTAVAVVPAAPVRRPAVEGGFDFFGTQKESGATESAAMEAVQNEDLADVVGQEALALHKAEAEGRFKPVDEASRGVGQVIDLTEHDETEQIDLKGLRSAVS